MWTIMENNRKESELAVKYIIYFFSNQHPIQLFTLDFHFVLFILIYCSWIILKSRTVDLPSLYRAIVQHRDSSATINFANFEFTPIESREFSLHSPIFNDSSKKKYLLSSNYPTNCTALKSLQLQLGEMLDGRPTTNYR